MAAIPSLPHVTPRCGHVAHSVAPGTDVNFPCKQCAHELEPAVFDALPSGHGEHVAEPASATQPFGHAVQLAQDAWNVPTGHGSHAVASEKPDLYLSLAHETQVSPSSSKRWPGRHTHAPSWRVKVAAQTQSLALVAPLPAVT